MINGSLINAFYYCKRECWLLFNRINLEDSSPDVRMGKILHELKEDKNSEVSINGIKIDKIKKSFLIEYKKSNTNIDAAKMQVLLYLYILKEKGIELKGKIEFLEKQRESPIIIELTQEEELNLICTIKNIEKLIQEKNPPEFFKTKKCKGSRNHV